MELRSKVFLLIVLLLCVGGFRRAHAQDVLIRGGFIEDSLRIGDKARMFLVAEYPSKLNILFPDSIHNFAPFEFERRIYFPTKTSNGTSYDSVVYYLSTFEVDRYQFLRLPVFQLNPMDCTTYFSRQDTILLTELVKDLPDTLTAQNLPLKVNTAYEKVSYLINYPVLLIVGGILVAATLVVWVAFGKKIRRHFRLKKMQRSHQKFLDTYTSQIENIRTAFSSLTTENALSHWKKYMEQLEARPYTKLTTRETTQLEKDESLGKNLQEIDRAIYGHNTRIIESLENLKAFADERFVQKVEEVKNG
jgi:hypothetical protein